MARKIPSISRPPIRTQPPSETLSVRLITPLFGTGPTAGRVVSPETNRRNVARRAALREMSAPKHKDAITRRP